MREITLEELLEAGCHFGHQVTRQNPKARDFVFEARDNIHVIDLAKTKEGLEQAAKFVKDLAARGGTLVVIGTKRQAQPIVAEEIKRAILETSDAAKPGDTGIYSVVTRWMGGTLTNFAEVAKNYKKLKDISYRLQSDDEKALYTKKEVGMWEKDRQKLEKLYGGLSEMKALPTALFIIDTHLEDLAVKEAYRMGVATVGIVDTNADPTYINHPIPANDDAVGSIKLIVSYIIDAWIEGKKNPYVKEESKEKPEVAKKEGEATEKKTVTSEKPAKKKKETKDSVAGEVKEEKKSGKRRSTKTQEVA